MTAYATTFRHMIIDQVAGNMARESQAGPLGLTNRPYESITAELMAANWDRLTAGAGTLAQIVARMCGTEKVCPVPTRYDVVRTGRTSFRRRTRRAQW